MTAKLLKQQVHSTTEKQNRTLYKALPYKSLIINLFTAGNCLQRLYKLHAPGFWQ